MALKTKALVQAYRFISFCIGVFLIGRNITMKIVFLEGLPGVGKTTIARKIESMNIGNIKIVHEIINQSILKGMQCNQKDFINNDNMKLSEIDDSKIVIIDRGPISTLSYNQARKIDDCKFDSQEVINWFESIKKIYDEEKVYTILLTTNNKSFQLSTNDTDGPYETEERQKLLECIVKFNCKKYCKNYKIIEYHKKNIEEVINEIIN